MKTHHNEGYVPKRLRVTAEMIEHLSDPVKRAIAEDYVRKGYWTLIQ